MHERENFIRGHPTQIFEHGAPPVDGVRDSVTSARANAVRLSQRMDVRHTSLSLAEPERGDQHVPALDALEACNLPPDRPIDPFLDVRPALMVHRGRGSNEGTRVVIEWLGGGFNTL